MPKTKIKNEISDLKEKILANGNIPAHIAIIMDGNGRWAKERGLPRVAGHKKGVDTVRETVKTCASLGVKYLTLYTFSTENWRRPLDEVSMLMKLLIKCLRDETDDLLKNNIRLTSIGDLNSLPPQVQKALKEAEEKTGKNNKMVLNIALSYSGRWDILNAVKKIAQEVKSNKTSIDEINQESFGKYLSTCNMPDVDLLIRTSGELRISNFLLWQIAYSEIFITDVYWPAFDDYNLFKAIESYQKRERRFGMVSEQIAHKEQGL